jgi:hypothetical protein
MLMSPIGSVSRGGRFMSILSEVIGELFHSYFLSCYFLTCCYIEPSNNYRMPPTDPCRHVQWFQRSYVEASCKNLPFDSGCSNSLYSW